jgi:putative RecB family exonuclease
MPERASFNSINDELHISHSQIANYLNCSLRYRFQYVEHRPQERVSIALPFGGAIHAAVEMFYRAIKNTGRVEAVEALHQRFEDCLALDLDSTEAPVVFKKDLPDRDAAIGMGRAMLNVFHASLNLKGLTVVDVELPLSATLYTEEGTATDFKLYGVIDLLLRGTDGELMVVDYKTAAKEMSKATANDDGQMSAYAYLLAANRYAPAKGNVRCRFDVLRKLKEPRLEYVHTLRTPFHRKRFAHVASAVLVGIENRVFLPQPSWRCTDCGYTEACKVW